jgi:RNA polymerase sigma-70 factor (ECF subfamily)
MATEDNRQEAFVRKLSTIQDALMGYVLSHIGDPADAQDILQEVYVVLWKRFDEFRGEGTFLSWAISIAHHKILHEYRRRSRSPLVFDEDLAARFATRYVECAGEMAERRLALERCLAKMSTSARRFLDMRYRLGMDLNDIASKAKKRANTIAVSLYRIRMSLAQCVQRMLDEMAGVAGRTDG